MVSFSPYGEMSERFKEPVLKTGDGATHRGFESHSLRQITIPTPTGGDRCFTEWDTNNKMKLTTGQLFDLLFPSHSFADFL